MKESKMITVDSCLCFKLETGGLIIGWLTVVGSILGSISSLILLILLSVYSCADFADTWSEETLQLCDGFRGVFIGLFVLLILLCIGFAYIGWKCIKGTEARDHFGVRPMMILLGFATVFSILQIFSLTTHGIVNGIFDAIVNGYFFIVVYSLYRTFRQEYESGGNRRPLQQVGKV